ncbi:MAG: IclR family transcriptional regulator [Chloroflexota bacterium]
MSAREQGKGRYTIRVVERAIDVLRLLSDGEPRLLAQVSGGVGLHSSTTFRVLATLALRNLVERDERTGQYSLGIATLELARAYQDTNYLRRIALPVLQRLRDDTGETVHLAVLENMDVVYLDKQQSFRAVGIMSSQVGVRLPAYCTGLGKVLLAFADQDRVADYLASARLPRLTDTTITAADSLLRELDRIRKRGYGFDRGEREAEIRCVAAPIIGRQGELPSAISVAGPASRMEPLETNRKLIDQVVSAARTISAALGYRQEHQPHSHDGQHRAYLTPGKGGEREDMRL